MGAYYGVDNKTGALRGFQIKGDLPSATELERINTALGSPKSDTPTEQANIGPLGYGYQAGMQNVEQLGSRIARQVGLDDLSRGMQIASEERSGILSGYKPQYSSYTDVNSITDVPSYVWEKAQESAFPMAAALGGAGVAALTAPAAIPAGIATGIGAAIPTFAMLAGANLERQMEERKIGLQETDVGAATLAAIPQTAADLALFRVLGWLGPFFRTASPAATTVANEVQKGLLRRVGETTVKAMLTEAGTESFQQAIEIFQANPEKLMQFGPEVREEILNALIAGGAVGGFLGPLGGGPKRTEKSKEPPQLTEDQRRRIEMEGAQRENQQAAALSAQQDADIASARAEMEKQDLLAREAEAARQSSVKAATKFSMRESAEAPDITDFSKPGVKITPLTAGENFGFEVKTPTGKPVLTTPSAEEANVEAKRLRDALEAPNDPVVQATLARLPLSELKPSERQQVRWFRHNHKYNPAGIDAPIGHDEAALIDLSLAQRVINQLGIQDQVNQQKIAEAAPKTTPTVSLGADAQVVAPTNMQPVSGGKETSPNLSVPTTSFEIREEASGVKPPLDLDSKKPKTKKPSKVHTVYETSVNAQGKPVQRVISSHPTRAQAQESITRLQRDRAQPGVLMGLSEVATGAAIAQKISAEQASEAAAIRAEKIETKQREARIARRKKEEAAKKALVDRMSGYGLRRTALHFVNSLSTPEAVGEGSYAKRIIKLATDVYSPGLTEQQFIDKAAGVIDHETIHALYDSGAFSDKEKKALAKYVATTKAILNGKPQPYTWLERAAHLYKDQSPEVQTEEAVAEAFRSWIATRKAPPHPTSLFKRMLNLLKGVFAYTDSKAKAGAIFESVRAGKRNDLANAAKPTAAAKLSRLLFGPGDTFFSAAREAVSGDKTKAAHGKQWLAFIQGRPGVKAEELEVSGLKHFLEQNADVQITREEILQHLADNQVTIEETVIDEDGVEGKMSRDDFEGLVDEAVREAEQEAIDYHMSHEWEAPWDIEEDTYTTEETTDDEGNVIEGEEQERYYVQENGSRVSYRNMGISSRIQHLAHRDEDGDLYFDTREDAEAYIDRLNERAEEQEREDLYSHGDLVDRGEIESRVREEHGSGTVEPKFEQYTLKGGTDYREILFSLPNNNTLLPYFQKTRIKPAPRKLAADDTHWEETDVDNIFAHTRVKDRALKDGTALHIEEIQSDWHQKGRDRGYERVPDAPFKKTWHEFVLKRMVKYAVDKGYDKLLWTTGADQNKRYTLSTHGSKLKVRRVGEDLYDLYVWKPGEENRDAPNASWQVTADRLGEMVGKDMAQSLLADLPSFNTTTERTGQSFEVGGRGMIGFYDKIVPDYLNKLLKKANVKIGKEEINGELIKQYPTVAGLNDNIRFHKERIRAYEAEMARLRASMETMKAELGERDPQTVYDQRRGSAAEQADVDRARTYIHARNRIENLQADIDFSKEDIAKNEARLAEIASGKVKEGERVYAKHIVHSIPLTPEVKALAKDGFPLFSAIPRESLLTAYHGTTKEFDHFQVFDDYMLDRALGVHFAQDPYLANSFVMERVNGREVGAKPGGRVIKAKLPGDSYLTVDQPEIDHLKGRTDVPLWRRVATDQRAIERAVMKVAYQRDPQMLMRYLRDARNIPALKAASLARGLANGQVVDIPGDGQYDLDKFLNNYGGKPYNDTDRKRAVQVARDVWKGQGYKGLKYINTSPMEMAGVGDPTSYIVFDPVDIKYSSIPRQSMLAVTPASIGAIQQRLVYGISNDVVSNTLRWMGAKDTLVQRIDRMHEKALILFQDRMLPVGRLIDKIRKNGGTITEAMDTYLQYELLRGKTGDMIRVANEQLFKPLTLAIGRLHLTQADIESLKQVAPNLARMADDFKSCKFGLFNALLYARHAPERNALIEARNPAHTDAEGNLIPALKDGSGISTDEAKAATKWFQSRPDWNNIAATEKLFRDIIVDTNAQRVAHNLTPDFNSTPVGDDFVKAGLPKGYVAYAPLRGVVEEDEVLDESDLRDIEIAIEALPVEERKLAKAGGSETIRVGAGLKVRGIEDRHALGRSSIASNIVQHAVLQNMQAVIRGQKNMVGQSLYNLLLAHGGGQVEHLGKNTDISRLIKIVAKTPLERKLVKGGVVKWMPNPLFKNRDDVLVTKVPDGKGGITEIAIEIPDTRIRKALTGATGLGSESAGQLVDQIGKVTRYMARMSTQWNPVFSLTNFPRDLQTAGINLGQYEIDGLSKAALGNVRHAIKAVYLSSPHRSLGYLTKAKDAPTRRYVDKNGVDWTELHDRFQKAGGDVSFWGLETIDDLTNRINNDIMADDTALTKGKAAVKRLGEFIEAHNKAIESSTRLAVFKALLDAGMSEEIAAQGAKNITVNFDKGGEWKPVLNSLYMFYNASLQGTMGIFSAGMRSRKVQKMMMGIVAAGAFQDMLMSMLAGEDDKGDNLYDQIPDYVLENRMVFLDPTGSSENGFIAIPMPYGYNALHNMGRSLSRMARGRYTAGEAISTGLGTVVDAFNPIGGTSSFLAAAAPTILDPLVELYLNKDWKDAPIYKEESPFGEDQPASQRYWNNTTPELIPITDWIHKISGGTEYFPGAVEISPNIIEYIGKYYTGGVGTFVGQLHNMAVNTIPDALAGNLEELEIRDIPVANKVIGNVTSRASTEKFYAIREDVNRARKELEGALKAGDTEGVQAAFKAYPGLLAIYAPVKAMNSVRQNLITRIRKIEANTHLPDAAKKKAVDPLKERLKDLERRSIALYNNQVRDR